MYGDLRFRFSAEWFEAMRRSKKFQQVRDKGAVTERVRCPLPAIQRIKDDARGGMRTGDYRVFIGNVVVRRYLIQRRWLPSEDYPLGRKRVDVHGCHRKISGSASSSQITSAMQKAMERISPL